MELMASEKIGQNASVHRPALMKELGAHHPHFFAYSPEIYTTNAIDSLNISLRKVTNNRGLFPNNESMLKLLYLTLNNIAKKWTMPIRDWKARLEPFLHRVRRQNNRFIENEKIPFTQHSYRPLKTAGCCSNEWGQFSKL